MLMATKRLQKWFMYDVSDFMIFVLILIILCYMRIICAGCTHVQIHASFNIYYMHIVTSIVTCILRLHLCRMIELGITPLHVHVHVS